MNKREIFIWIEDQFMQVNPLIICQWTLKFITPTLNVSSTYWNGIEIHSQHQKWSDKDLNRTWKCYCSPFTPYSRYDQIRK